MLQKKHLTRNLVKRLLAVRCFFNSVYDVNLFVNSKFVMC